MVGTSPRQVPAQLRLQVESADEWADAVSRAFVPLRVGSAGDEFTASLEQLQLGPFLTLTTVRSDASEVRRTPGTLRSHPHDDVLLSWQRSGTGSVEQFNRRARFTPGVVSAYEASSPYSLRFAGPIEQVVIQIPRSELRLRAPELREITARPLPASPSLSALTLLLGSVMEHGVADPVPPPDAEALAAALTALVPTALRAVAPPSDMDDDALLRLAYSVVRARFAEPGFDPELLARDLNVSLRKVQRLFARAGSSPAEVLRHERLAHARERLLAGQTVGRAAHSSGFVDPDSFTRAFKRRYGVVPSEIFRSGPMT